MKWKIHAVNGVIDKPYDMNVLSVRKGGYG